MDMDIIEWIRTQFSHLASLPDDQLDLIHGMLLISRFEYPRLNESYYDSMINTMSTRLKQRISGKSDPQIHIEELNRVFVEEEKFCGNTEDYYNPENSYLSRVLDRRTGIPITLSVVYMEIGRRAGLDIHGVGLPGHFITVLIHPPHRFYLDPFNKGAILTEWECRQKIILSHGHRNAYDPGILVPVNSKSILERTLRNLKSIYFNMNQGIKAFQMIQWILELNRDASTELKDRAMIYENIGDPRRAIKDLERYIRLNPSAEDVDAIRQKIQTLSSQASRIH